MISELARLGTCIYQNLYGNTPLSQYNIALMNVMITATCGIIIANVYLMKKGVGKYTEE